MSKQIAAADGANTAKGQPTPAADTETQQGSTDDILAAMLAEDAAENPKGVELESAASADGAEGEPEDLSHSESEEGSQQDEAGEADGAAESDEEAAPAEEAPEEAEGEEGKGLNPRVQKRIDKLTAKNARLKEELESLRKQVEANTSKPDGVAPNTSELPEFLRDDPKVVSVLQEQQKAQREVEAAQRLKRQLREDADSVIQLLNKNGQRVSSVEDAADLLDEYVQTQRERVSEGRVAIAGRRQEIEAQREASRKSLDALAQTRAPWLSDEDDPRTEQVQQLLKNYPRLAQDPAARFIAVAVVKEMTAIRAAEALQKQKSKPGAKSVVIAPRSAAAGGTGRSAAVAPKPMNSKAAAMQRLVENPSEDSLAAALDAELGVG
jgi:hypothetical protein